MENTSIGTDYSQVKYIGSRPWSGELCENDILTRDQAFAVDETRLADFGFCLQPHSFGNDKKPLTYLVAVIKK